MTKQEFIDSFIEWMNKTAEELFPAQVELPIGSAPIIVAYKPKKASVRVNNIASHYGQPTELIHRIISDLGISEIKTRTQGGNVITKDDCLLLVAILEKKYNNFNE